MGVELSLGPAPVAVRLFARPARTYRLANKGRFVP